MSKVIKPGQTFTGSARVRVYQPSRECRDRLVPGKAQTGQRIGKPDSPAGQATDTARKPGMPSYLKKRERFWNTPGSQAEQSAAKDFRGSICPAGQDCEHGPGRSRNGYIPGGGRQGYDDGINRAEADISTGLVRIGQAVEQAGRRLEEHSEEIKAGITEIALMIAEKNTQKEVSMPAEPGWPIWWSRRRAVGA